MFDANRDHVPESKRDPDAQWLVVLSSAIGDFVEVCFTYEPADWSVGLGAYLEMHEVWHRGAEIGCVMDEHAWERLEREALDEMCRQAREGRNQAAEDRAQARAEERGW